MDKTTKDGGGEFPRSIDCLEAQRFGSVDRASTLMSGFYIYIAAACIGKRTFRMLCQQQMLTTILTPTDEALAMLIVDNQFDRWMDMKDQLVRTKSNIKPKYTVGDCKRTKKGSPKRYGGWSRAGIEQFSRYKRESEQARTTQTRREFDDWFLSIHEPQVDLQAHQATAEPLVEAETDLDALLMQMGTNGGPNVDYPTAV